MEIADWPRSGLPWIAFWLKELLFWGTLDPAAAFILARRDVVDRPGAEREAKAYYEQLPDGLDDNEILDPRRISDWVAPDLDETKLPRGTMGRELSVKLSRDAATYVRRRLDVMYLEAGSHLKWIDPAGYLVATSERPHDWPSAPHRYHFQLDVDNSRIKGDAYRRFS